MKTERSFFVSEVEDDYWKARYNSETNEVNLEYDTNKALDTHLRPLIRNYIHFKGQDLARVIQLLQKLQKESEL